jgi:hypothetical protein
MLIKIKEKNQHAARNKSGCVINDTPLYVQPSLAVLIGFNNALVLQQIEFLSTDPNTWVKAAGHAWARISYGNLNEMLPFWGLNTIIKAVSSLEESGLLISCKLGQGVWSKTKYYRVDYERLNTISGVSSDEIH